MLNMIFPNWFVILYYSKIFYGSAFIDCTISGCCAKVVKVSDTVAGEQNAVAFVI